LGSTTSFWSVLRQSMSQIRAAERLPRLLILDKTASQIPSRALRRAAFDQLEQNWYELSMFVRHIASSLVLAGKIGAGNCIRGADYRRQRQIFQT
jgi:hypothetical protein